MKRAAKNLTWFRRVGAAFAVSVLAFVALPTLRADGADRVILYPTQNPSIIGLGLMQRYPRIMIGNFLRDMLGAGNLSGTYADIQINPVASSMEVNVAPATAGTYGSLYQLGQDDVNPMPIQVSPGQPQLPADPTEIMILGLLETTSSALGPMTAPVTSGQSVYYLVEAQIQSVDGNPQQTTFVNGLNGKTFPTVNTERSDAIVFQLVAGTPGVSPTIPSTDSGWISIGTILIPYGTTQITSGMIAMSPGFSGFTQAIGCAGSTTNPCATLATSSPQPAGVAAFNSSGQLFSTSIPSPAPTITCGNPNCTASGSTGVISVTTPTPVPSPTCATGTCSFSGFTLTVPATATPYVLPSLHGEVVFAMPQVTPVVGASSVPVYFNPNVNTPVITGSHMQCATAGTGGSAPAWTIVKVAGVSRNGTPATASPTFSAAAATAAVGGATVAPTALPTDTTAGAPNTWFDAQWSVVPTTAMYGNCSITMEFNYLP